MEAKGPIRSLARVLDPGRSVILPGAYDVLSAKLVEEAGFEAVYIGSYATAASAYGLPDVGALTLDELVRPVRPIVDAVSVPVITDAEGGFFDPPNIWRTVRAFESAGASAIHIEDHAGGKHTDLPQTLIPLDLMIERLRAAMDARSSPDFAVIARTDAIWATKNAEEARRRLAAFAEIGIEYLFPTGASPETLRQLRRAVPGKFVTINLPEVSDLSAWDGAADLVIDYGFCLRASAKALGEALGRMRAGAGTAATDVLLEDERRFERRLDYEAFTQRAVHYVRRPAREETEAC